MTEKRDLKVHVDARGWFAEILRNEHTNGHIGGQFYVTVAKPGISKANHYHTRKTEWFCVVKGKGLLVLKDISSGKTEEIEMGDNNMVTVRIDPNVAHSIRNTGDDDLFLIAYITEPFDPEDPDTFPYEL
jgi:UDP-2-acetamido-2,6-beta-L-arabino-hexul-4-ose reductase